MSNDELTERIKARIAALSAKRDELKAELFGYDAAIGELEAAIGLRPYPQQGQQPADNPAPKEAA